MAIFLGSNAFFNFTACFLGGLAIFPPKNRKFAAKIKNLKNKQHKNELMKKISLIVMSCMIACGLLASHGMVKGGVMSSKVEDTVSIDKKVTDSRWLSNNSDTLEVDTAGEDSVVNVVAYFCKGDRWRATWRS